MSVPSVVIVVGGGNAGLVAAIASLEAGARAVLLESSGRAERGGNTRYASAVIRTVHSGVDDLRSLVTDSAHVPWDRIESAPYTRDTYRADGIGHALPPSIDSDLATAFVDASLSGER
jgi:tricarballylate dehydrogenase